MQELLAALGIAVGVALVVRGAGRQQQRHRLGARDPAGRSPATRSCSSSRATQRGFAVAPRARCARCPASHASPPVLEQRAIDQLSRPAGPRSTSSASTPACRRSAATLARDFQLGGLRPAARRSLLPSAVGGGARRPDPVGAASRSVSLGVRGAHASASPSPPCSDEGAVGSLAGALLGVAAARLRAGAGGPARPRHARARVPEAGREGEVRDGAERDRAAAGSRSRRSTPRLGCWSRRRARRPVDRLLRRDQRARRPAARVQRDAADGARAAAHRRRPAASRASAARAVVQLAAVPGARARHRSPRSPACSLGDCCSRRRLPRRSPGYLAFAFPLGDQRVVDAADRSRSRSPAGSLATLPRGAAAAARPAPRPRARRRLPRARRAGQRGRAAQRARLAARRRRRWRRRRASRCWCCAVADGRRRRAARDRDGAARSRRRSARSLRLARRARRAAARLNMLAVALRALRATTMRSLALAATGAVAVFGSVAIEGARDDLLRGLDGDYARVRRAPPTCGSSPGATTRRPHDLRRGPALQRARRGRPGRRAPCAPTTAASSTSATGACG